MADNKSRSNGAIEACVDLFGAAQADGDGFDCFDDILVFPQQRVDGQAGVDDELFKPTEPTRGGLK
jgi:hypothetical protein